MGFEDGIGGSDGMEDRIKRRMGGWWRLGVLAGLADMKGGTEDHGLVQAGRKLDRDG